MIKKKELYILVGSSGSGKSTFCKQYFYPLQIVSSDQMRQIVCDDETNQKCSNDAFQLFHYIIEKKMKWNALAVADATNLTKKARKKLFDLAKKFEYTTIIVVMETELDECLKRNREREISRPEHIVIKHYNQFEIAKEDIKDEGYDNILTYENGDLTGRN